MAYFPRRRKNGAIRKNNTLLHPLKLDAMDSFILVKEKKKVIRVAEIFSIVQFCFGVTEVRGEDGLCCGAGAFSNVLILFPSFSFPLLTCFFPSI